jgi:hypothetical protein
MISIWNSRTHRSPLEVTASADERNEATTAAILEPRKGSPFIKAGRCRKDWLVHPLPTANINKVRAHIDRYLADIEATGLERFFSPIDSDLYPSVERIYEDLAIEGGSVARWKEPGQIGMTLPGGGGLVTTEHLQMAIKVEAFKEDNRRKLGSAGTKERHLFVYVHPGNFLPWVALRDEDPPPEPPHLPPEVTHVWAVAEFGQPAHCVVWSARRNMQWEKLGIITSRFSVLPKKLCVRITI